MAGAHCATTFSLRLHFATSATVQLSHKPAPFISSISVSTPKRPTNRKNYLRPKILKTLTRPYLVIPKPPLQSPDITDFPPREEDSNVTSSDQPSGESTSTVAGEEVQELGNQELEQSEAYESSESVEIPRGNVGNFPNSSVFKFGLWLVGAFVFQTVCAVWVFGSAEIDQKDKILENRNGINSKHSVLEMDIDQNNKSRINLFVNGKITVDDEMERKIEEIRVMAHEAREKERMERRDGSLDGNESDFEDEEDDGFGRSGIEKEVKERLIKLRERLEKNREKFASSSGKSLREDGQSKGGVKKIGVDVTPESPGMMFKRKNKFKGSLNEQRNRPKGFTGVSAQSDGKTKNGRLSKGNEVTNRVINVDSGFNMSDGDQSLELDLLDGNVDGSFGMDLEGNGRSKQNSEVSKSTRTVESMLVADKERRQQGMIVDDSESKLRKVQDKSDVKPLVQTENSKEPSILETYAVSNQYNRVENNGSVKSRGFGQKQSASSKKPFIETDWWLSLPYVLVILMQRGPNGEGPRGLYTLKSSSGAEGELSHIVAFQDRGDASNFCYLLQSFFEDLGDFSTDVLPLSIKELREAVKSHTKKVIVVKKGELQLYAGKPLSDAEMAIHSLIEQS